MPCSILEDFEKYFKGEISSKEVNRYLKHLQSFNFLKR